MAATGTTRPEFVTGTQVLSERPMQIPPRRELPYLIELAYPAAVYRAAADEVARAKRQADGEWKGAHDPLTICVSMGPHVPGAACQTVHIEALLRGVADAIDPPAGVVDVTQAEPAAPTPGTEV
jgi:hypothetical protein